MQTLDWDTAIVWTGFLDDITSCSRALSVESPLVTPLCWQVSLWAELWPAPGRPCPPGSPRWPNPQPPPALVLLPTRPLRPNPESLFLTLWTESRPRPWKLTVATVRRPAAAALCHKPCTLCCWGCAVSLSAAHLWSCLSTASFKLLRDQVKKKLSSSCSSWLLLHPPCHPRLTITHRCC